VAIFVAARMLVNRLLSPAEPQSAAADLDGSEWVLLTLNGQSLVEGTHITLSFDGAEARGYAGCNGYGSHGGVFAGPGRLKERKEVAQTVRLCLDPEGVIEQEEAYMGALQAAVSYRLDGDRLELSDGSGRATLIYQRRTGERTNPADLIGTKWQLVSLDGDSLIPGTTITIVFLPGEATGSAGCRDYAARYEVIGDSLIVTYLEMKDTACTPTVELLAQEGRFTDALGTNYFLLAGDRLEMYTWQGSTLVFTRLPGEAAAPTLP
jgi:heat shock protein HslJ